MRAGRGKQLAGVGAVLAVAALIAAAVTVRWGGSNAGHQRSADQTHERSDRGDEHTDRHTDRLPDGLTPLDPASPNPTGSDPLAIGAPPDIQPPASPEEWMERAQQVLAAAAATPALPKAAAPGGPDPGPRAEADSLLVSFAPGTSPDEIAAALAGAGVSGTPIAGIDAVEVDTTGQDQRAVTAALEAVDAVEHVEPNLIRSVARTPNDPGLAVQLPNLNAVVAPTAWDVADTGANVVVAVLDTGVDLDHPDLTANLVAGRDVVNNDSTPQDDNGHGTEAAGIIGAATNNGIGIAGVAWNAQIMPVKVLDAGGHGNDAQIASGIVWATDHGATVINMSLGGPGVSSTIDDAVAYALDHEVVLVAAAGNDSSQVISYPAAAPGVLGVTATNAAAQFAWFSNYGPFYFLAAPGIDVLTTALADGPGAAYAYATGTSFSSPMVAGVAALLRERHPGWGWLEVDSELIRTSRDAGPAGFDDTYGYGIVDAAAALGVGPIGPTSQPNLADDAGNLRTAARTIATGLPASETIGYETDRDWFAFDVPGTAGATITVTPPPVLQSGFRAAEMDPIVELYGPGGGLIAQVDEAQVGEPEQLQVNLADGRHTLRVLSFDGSASPGPYTVQVSLGTELASSAWAPSQSAFRPDAEADATTVADFNGDGRQDVALLTGFDHDAPIENELQLYVLLQQPGGTLGAPQQLDTHTTTGDMLVSADLDGDGDSDLALGTGMGLDVAWNQSGTITAPTLYAVAGGVQAAVAANQDGTGPTELIARSAGSVALTSLQWTGSSFSATPLGINGPVAGRAGIGFAAGDLDDDDRIDIATFVTGGIAVYAQQAGGGWAAPVTVAVPDVGPDTTSLAAGDITGDGRADLVMAGGGNEPSSFLAYVVQQAGGGFGTATTLPSYGIPGPVEIGDVNDDGRADAVVMHNGWEAVGIYQQTAIGTLAPEDLLSQPYASGYGNDGLALGDVDADGVDDIVNANHDYGLVVVRHQAAALAEGPGPWLATAAPAPHATGVATSVQPRVTFGRDVSPGTVNADTVRLFNGRSGSAIDASVSLIARTATLTPSVALQPGTPYQVRIAGVTDALGLETAFERVVFTTAAGERPSYPVSGTYIPFPVDLDGNGYQDMFWYGPGTTADSIWLFGADGRTVVPTSMAGTLTPVVGDFNGNGYDDIFWYGPGSGIDVMWWNGRDGITTEVMLVNGVYVPVAGDFDRNGYDDIFWYGPGTTVDSIWSFGPTGRTTVLQAVGNTSYRPLTADYTRDGFADIFWYLPGTGTDGLWRGQPSGFAKGASALAANGTYGTRALDFNGDGFHEVFWFTTNLSSFWRSGTTNFVSSQAGPPIPAGAQPVVGDFTGDARDDLFAYVPGATADTFYFGQANGVG